MPGINRKSEVLLQMSGYPSSQASGLRQSRFRTMGLLNLITSGLPVTQGKSRDSPGLLCNLAFGVWSLRLPQFDRISLRVMQASKPAVGI